MISYQAALELIDKLPATALVEQVKLSEGLGRVTACDTLSSLENPPFRNSAMDGFAVRSADTQSACSAHPTELHVLGSIAAGDAPGEALEEDPKPAVEISSLQQSLLGEFQALFCEPPIFFA